jgi:hypothetical protein
LVFRANRAREKSRSIRSKDGVMIIQIEVFAAGGKQMKRLALSLVVGMVALSQGAHAEDINQVFSKVNEYVQQKNYPKALEELSWAQKELEKMHQARLSQLLPSEVAGFKGADPELNSALGFSNVERQYSSGEKSIQLSLTGTGGTEGMGGLAGLAKMGMMMGGVQAGKDQFRIDGRTASLDTTGDPELTVFLESGSLLQLRAGEGVDGATLKKFAEGLKVGDLDSYLKGTAK